MLAETRPAHTRVFEWTFSPSQKGGVAIIGLPVIGVRAVDASVSRAAPTWFRLREQIQEHLIR